MTRATHEQVVARLTTPAEAIALTLYREQLVRKGAASPLPVDGGCSASPVCIRSVRFAD